MVTGDNIQYIRGFTYLLTDFCATIPLSSFRNTSSIDWSRKVNNTTQRITSVDIDSLPPLIKVKTAALIRGNSDKFIRDQCAKGLIKASKLGGSWRINRDEFRSQCGLL